MWAGAGRVGAVREGGWRGRVRGARRVGGGAEWEGQEGGGAGQSGRGKVGEARGGGGRGKVEGARRGVSGNIIFYYLFILAQTNQRIHSPCRRLQKRMFKKIGLIVGSQSTFSEVR